MARLGPREMFRLGSLGEQFALKLAHWRSPQACFFALVVLFKEHVFGPGTALMAWIYARASEGKLLYTQIHKMAAIVIKSVLTHEFESCQLLGANSRA